MPLRRRFPQGLSRLLCAAGLATSMLAAAPGLVPNVVAAPVGQHHALLLWIGQYGSAERNLPGIDHDARRARVMASAMGVPEHLRTELSDEALTLGGLSRALEALERRVAPGDRVFIYFSGHGKQIDGARFGTRCSEGLVTRDGALFLDEAVHRSLQRLAAKADQVVMMNDSCHSGGAATKRFDPDDDEVPKAYPAPLAQPADASAPAACGEAVNKSLDWSGPLQRGAGAGQGRWLYIAAAASDEIAYASPRGSRATQAWQTCLAQPGTDTDRNGQITGEELRQCAQRLVDAAGPKRQTITLQGDVGLSVAPSRR